MLFPHSESKRVRLRPAVERDAPAAYEVLFRLGYRGLPTLDRFSEEFSRGVAANFLVCDQKSGDVIGTSSLSNLSPAGNLDADINLSTGLSHEQIRDAHVLTVNFAFAMWRTRKVYFHTVENGPAPQDLGFGDLHADLLTTEAVLRDHWYFHGRLWDVHVKSIRREKWDAHGTELVLHAI